MKKKNLTDHSNPSKTKEKFEELDDLMFRNKKATAYHKKKKHFDSKNKRITNNDEFL